MAQCILVGLLWYVCQLHNENGAYKTLAVLLFFELVPQRPYWLCSMCFHFDLVSCPLYSSFLVSSIFWLHFRGFSWLSLSFWDLLHFRACHNSYVSLFTFDRRICQAMLYDPAWPLIISVVSTKPLHKLIRTGSQTDRNMSWDAPSSKRLINIKLRESFKRKNWKYIGFFSGYSQCRVSISCHSV